ncbi:uncharacterized protein K444DRAFT_412886 [Hyaloscypha bicolor E]|uniref:C2H2-type domain-containing protein n=1 Tax=Hyaloscypha bicolor E TaxID=1095630 RepID=A0A2J6T964_9HELO|nr:uncharacterized protein K444DRAFT_412886 [Hyaloscypha bicolor E]PMD59493.1 hypothetical protein K444DRAFT_412886 [Hyaloscypha bicolor E]
MELEISEEGAQVPIGAPSTSTIPSPSSTSYDMNPSKSHDTESSQELASPALKATPSGDKWLCEFTNCGKCFSHRHKLNRHRKYHLKPYRCLDPSCSTRGIAFSLNKDLARHHSQHSGQRLYCPHRGCSYAFGGGENGFSRKDNLKRHIKTRH